MGTTNFLLSNVTFVLANPVAATISFGRPAEPVCR